MVEKSLASPVLIAGTGRCGTTATYRVLTSFGLDCGRQEHSFGKDAGVTSLGFMHNFQPEKILLQIREPLACIASLQTVRKPLDLSILGIDQPDPRCLQALMQWYYFGNIAISKRAANVFATQHAPELMAFEFGLPLRLVELAYEANRTANTRRDLPSWKPLTADDLRAADADLWQRIADMWAGLVPPPWTVATESMIND